MIDVEFTLEEQDAIRNRIKKYRVLKEDERQSGKASFEIFDLEDAFGDYLWVLERIADA